MRIEVNRFVIHICKIYFRVGGFIIWMWLGNRRGGKEMIKFSLKQKDGSYNCGAFVVAYYKALKEKFPEGLKDRNDEHCTISIDIDINEIYDQIKFTTEDKDEIKKLLCKYAMYFFAFSLM